MFIGRHPNVKCNRSKKWGNICAPQREFGLSGVVKRFFSCLHSANNKTLYVLETGQKLHFSFNAGRCGLQMTVDFIVQQVGLHNGFFFHTPLLKNFEIFV